MSKGLMFPWSVSIISFRSKKLTPFYCRLLHPSIEIYSVMFVHDTPAESSEYEPVGSEIESAAYTSFYDSGQLAPDGLAVGG